MKLCPNVDLGRSLVQIFNGNPYFSDKIAEDCARQTATAEVLLQRFCGLPVDSRREMMILADEVGLGKTYVALAVAVSILDAARRGETAEGLPSNKPVVLVVTPSNDALYNKWLREAESFKNDCARIDGDLDWLQIRSPLHNETKSGNVIDASNVLLDASRSKPLLMIAKQSMFGATLHDRDVWRRRGLAAVFGYFGVPTDSRRYFCRKGRIFDSFGIPELRELLDLRSAGPLWEDNTFADLERVFERTLESQGDLADCLSRALSDKDEEVLSRNLDSLARQSLTSLWPKISLVVIDEIHGWKNEHVKSRRHFEGLIGGKVCRVLGLSATPFQLRQDELLSVLKLRRVLLLPKARMDQLDEAVSRLDSAMSDARHHGSVLRDRWKYLQSTDQGKDLRVIDQHWEVLMAAGESARSELAAQIRPPRVSHALAAALALEKSNRSLRHWLHPFVIRHHHPHKYRQYFVGKNASSVRHSSPHFSWVPGMEVRGSDELLQYVMMRAVSLVEEERGLPALGAELTGSYRHLLHTAAVWKKLAASSNPLLRDYRAVLQQLIDKNNAEVDPDSDHHKLQATVRRAMEFFKLGQKSLIFCVYTKTAEAVRDQLRLAIDTYLGEIKTNVFGDPAAFNNFRRRFFNRQEVLYSLIQDQPLLGKLENGRVGVPEQIMLGFDHLRQVGELLVGQGAHADADKHDRRLIMAATEQIAVRFWDTSDSGNAWLATVLSSCPELKDAMLSPAWLVAREPLSRGSRVNQVTVDPDSEGYSTSDPLDAEEPDSGEQGVVNPDEQKNAVNSWVRRLQDDSIGGMLKPYFREGLIQGPGSLPPLLVANHQHLLVQLDLKARSVAGQVFRRILMADEFLLRYLADIERDSATRWATYLSERYNKPLGGHLESLRDRVQAYLETLVRARHNAALMSGYQDGADNRNVVQLVKGDTPNRDRYFLGFNTPYRPDILVSTSVGQEGIDLHRECRHVIHHDLCWNPATLEQRTGRVDRIGSKVERELMGSESGAGSALEIAVPYLAATYDERMFEELHKRAQLLEVTLGGEMRVEGKAKVENTLSERDRRDGLGIDAEDEDLGEQSDSSIAVDLPRNMIERLRIDLAVWKRGP